MSNELVAELREAAKRFIESDPELSGVLAHAAYSIEEYEQWLEIMRKDADRRDELIEGIKRLLREISVVLHILSGKEK